MSGIGRMQGEMRGQAAPVWKIEVTLNVSLGEAPGGKRSEVPRAVASKLQFEELLFFVETIMVRLWRDFSRS